MSDDLSEMPRFKFKPWPSVTLVMIGTGALIAVVLGSSVYLGTRVDCVNASEVLSTLRWIGAGLCVCLFSEIVATYSIRESEIQAGRQPEPERRKH